MASTAHAGSANDTTSPMSPPSSCSYTAFEVQLLFVPRTCAGQACRPRSPGLVLWSAKPFFSPSTFDIVHSAVSGRPDSNQASDKHALTIV